MKQYISSIALRFALVFSFAFLSMSVYASTLDGYVRDENGKGLKNVVVSDGETIGITDANGYYTICSHKKHGFIFVSLPSGYEAPLNGVFPDFWRALSAEEIDESHDFTLKKVDNEKHALLVLGDFHLCNRKSLMDLEQFRVCAAELNSQIEKFREEGIRSYVLTLGDMTWDLYWDNSQKLKYCNFDLPAYKDFINKEMVSVPFFHTMGNHDNDYKAIGDWDAALPYRKHIGPNWYSFNIGGIHYIVLDNIICTNQGTVSTRSDKTGINEDQWSWLRSDLSAVKEGTPVIVAMHSQFHKISDGKAVWLNEDVLKLNELISARHKLHYITGHSHMIGNVGGPDDRISEHNAGAICGDWWWTGRLSWEAVLPEFSEYKGREFFMQARDGAPSGYTIYKMDGSKWTSQFKGFGISEDVQFKAYDRNCIEINSKRYPVKEKYREPLDKDAGEYAEVSDSNIVLINVWNWDPSWKVEVYEGKKMKKLEVRMLENTRDPMAILTYDVARYTEGKSPKSTFMAKPNYRHMFEVRAKSAKSDLTIVVTDGYGRVYKQIMERPKAFTVDWE